jgi:hypothetical protein
MYLILLFVFQIKIIASPTQHLTFLTSQIPVIAVVDITCLSATGRKNPTLR